jgi:hypothetical protein
MFKISQRRQNIIQNFNTDEDALEAKKSRSGNIKRDTTSKKEKEKFEGKRGQEETTATHTIL